jgi:hypothetical protein
LPAHRTILSTLVILPAAAAAGGSTGDKIATWQRMGSVYGQPANKKKPPQDPYQVGCMLLALLLLPLLLLL